MSIFDTSAGATSGVLDPIAAKLKNPFSTTVNNNGEKGVDFPGGFQIMEYVDNKVVNSTIIRLIGNMMPMRPFTWSGEQRLVKEYYPGNPEAAVQILGPKEGPLVIKGRWKDKRYKDPTYYGVAYQYNLAVNEMRKRGNIVKFGMDGGAGSWWRWGIIERGEFRMDKLSWIDYEIEFFIISEKQPINNYFSADEKQAPSAVNQNLINQAAAFQAAYSAVPTSMPQSISDIMNNLTSGIAKNINAVTGFVDAIINTAQSVEASAFRALGLIKNARAYCAKFSRSVDALSHGFTHMSTQGNGPGQARDTYTNIAYLLETNAGVFALTAFLAQMQAQFEALALTVPKARYRVQAGDTLQNISIKFYGIADHWTDIQDHNNLHSTDLATATWPTKPVLEIPHL